MARKKKSKKKKADPKKADPKKAGPKKATSKKKGARKKAARKKTAAEKKTRADGKGGATAEDVPTEVTVDESSGAGAPAVDESVPEDEELPVEDLDAALDDDLGDSDDLDALIAAAVAGAERDDDEPVSAESLKDEEPAQVPDDREDPVESLEGEDLPVEVLDIEADASEPAPVSEAEDAAAEAVEVVTTVTPSTDEELEGAIDLGDVSTPEVRDRLLAQALAHAEMQDARYRVPFSDPRRAGRWKAAAAAVLFLVAAVVAVAPPAWVQPDPPARIDTTARARSIRRALLLQAQQVDAYRVRLQRLPGTLDELPGHLGGLRYVRSGNRAYQLVAYLPEGGTIVYDSTNPAPEFETLRPAWAAGAVP